MPQEIKTKLTQQQVDSYNYHADSLYTILKANYQKTQDFKHWQDSMSEVTVIEYVTKKDWSLEAQNYVVPGFVAIVSTAMVFGLILIWDFNKGLKEKNKKDLRILDFLDKE